MADTSISNRHALSWVTLITLLLISATVTEARPARNGKIAFTSDRDGNLEIYVMNPDGTNQVRLTSNSTVDDHPTWSPDGTKLAFIGQGPTGGFAIFQMDADGTGKSEITPIIFNPLESIYWSMSWSPDASEIVFQDEFQGTTHIFVVNLLSRVRRILATGNQPDWSPDGSRILFCRQVAWNASSVPLQTIGPDGANLQSIVGPSPNEWHIWYVDPRWSPSSDAIVFQGFDWANSSTIEIARPDGSGRGIFYDGNLDGHQPAKPDWSPDGSTIVFHVSVGASGTLNTEIFTRNLDGAGLLQVTDTAGNNFKPSSWQPLVPAVAFDYAGDRRAGISVQRPADNKWYVAGGPAGFTSVAWGQAGDLLAPADYDGDGKTDIAVFRPSNGTWYVVNSSNGAFLTYNWGADGDLPVPADHNADGKADLVLFRQSNGMFYRRMSDDSFSNVSFGVVGDKPVIGDFDNDGQFDIGVFRPSNNNWYIRKSMAGFFVQTWGEAGDIPVPADYDGDGQTDLAVWRSSNGRWYRAQSAAGFDGVNWGQAGDKPIPADYDGDGKADVAIFRPASGTWYMIGTTIGQLVQQFGQDGDVPTPSAFID